MKIVLDTNVLLSGLMYRESVPGRIVTAWREGEFDVVMSPEQLNEIGRVLAYPKIRRVLRWDDRKIEAFVKQLRLRVETVRIDRTAGAIVRDPEDAPILAILITAGADMLVTGDGDLLAVSDRFPIFTPSQFSRRL